MTMALQPKDHRVKRLGDEILNHVRAWLDRECKNDLHLRFLVNRWIFLRLQLDYRQETKRVKKALMKKGCPNARVVVLITEIFKCIDVMSRWDIPKKLYFQFNDSFFCFSSSRASSSHGSSLIFLSRVSTCLRSSSSSSFFIS
jgi:hypothetical protein